MKAVEANLLDFLKRSEQFSIPIYQRTYSWTKRECRQIWDDVLRTGRNDGIPAHFVGSIVYIQESPYQVSSQSSLLVIDGQQRLTTMFLIIEALARRMGDTEPVKGFSAKKLRHYYLTNPLEDGDGRYKLLLTQTDRETLLAVVDHRPWPLEYSLLVREGFEFFEEQIADLGADLTPLCKGLAKLMIVDVSLTREQDNPQLIFESMNSTGRELTQADLIRNYVLMDLKPGQQTRLYNEHWRPMEIAFGQEAYGKHFDSFMRHYLTVKTGNIPNVRKVYEAFKAYAGTTEIRNAGVDALVADIHFFAGHYCAMALGQETNPKLAAAFRDLRELRVDVAYPFLLELYHDYVAGVLTTAEMERIVRLVESYVFRRAVCGIPTNSLNKTFATFCRALRKDRYLESIKAHFALLPSYRRFPSEDEFRREIKVRDLYNFRSRSYWLRRMENHERKERVLVDEYTVEHILPQNKDLSEEWRQALGSAWRTVQETWLHTLGNLTLTGYNAEYSDRTFGEKRDMKGGFRESPLRVNEGLGQLVTWDEDAIRQRADRLAEQAVRIWAAPELPADVLDQYRPEARKPEAYTLDDHPNLAASAPMRPVFDRLRRELQALDPCVSEEFLKLYVAYKAETNFVDVIPQVKRLLLTINIDFHELHEPRGLARDVTGMGRWGNGNVEVGLSSLDDVPYMVGLARQALEKQLGNGEGEA